MKTKYEKKNTLSQNSCELAEMLKKLPREERLRVEGIIIGIGIRCDKAASSAQNSA